MHTAAISVTHANHGFLLPCLTLPVPSPAPRIPQLHAPSARVPSQALCQGHPDEGSLFQRLQPTDLFLGARPNPIFLPRPTSPLQPGKAPSCFWLCSQPSGSCLVCLTTPALDACCSLSYLWSLQPHSVRPRKCPWRSFPLGPLGVLHPTTAGMSRTSQHFSEDFCIMYSKHTKSDGEKR